MSEFTQTFITYDEEWNPGRRIGTELEQWLDSLDLDTVNEVYIIRVEITRPYKAPSQTLAKGDSNE